MRQLLAALTVIGSLSLPLIGCGPPCKVTRDPDCDYTKTFNNCRDLCVTENGEQIDDFEADDEQESNSSEGVDG